MIRQHLYIFILLISIKGFSQDYDSIFEINKLIIDTPFRFNHYREHFIITEGYKCDSTFMRDTIYSQKTDLTGKIISQIYGIFDGQIEGVRNYQYDSKGRITVKTHHQGIIGKTQISSISKTFYYYNEFDSIQYLREYIVRRIPDVYSADSFLVSTSSFNSNNWNDWLLESETRKVYDDKNRLTLITINAYNEHQWFSDKYTYKYFYNSANEVIKSNYLFIQMKEKEIMTSIESKIYYLSSDNDSSTIDTVIYSIHRVDTVVSETKMKLSKSRKIIEKTFNNNERKETEYFTYDDKDRLLVHKMIYIANNANSEYSYTYIYDDLERISERIEICKKCCFPNFTRYYKYDK